jgi:serine/threonine protein kinase
VSDDFYKPAFLDGLGYHVVGELGSGASATVLLAIRHSDELSVAIKIPRTEADQPRLRAEGQLLSVVSHPNIVQLIDVIDDGINVALVMEHLTAGTLKDAQHRSALSVVEVLVPVLDALHALHTAGWIHGDVKPTNIGFREDRSPTLLDFGVAHSTGNTHAPCIESTAGYIDPLAIETARRSPADDIYSVGVIGIELINNLEPQTADTDLLHRVQEVFKRAVHPDRSVRILTAAGLIGSLTEATQRGLDTPAKSPLTEVFRPITRPSSLATIATPTPPKRWLLTPVALLAIICTLMIGGAIAVRSWQGKARNELSTGVLATRATCNPEEVAFCVESLQRTAQGIAVRFRGSRESIPYEIGRKDDVLRVGNFFCGATETLALYRPSTGVVYYFQEWPSPGTEAPVVAHATGLVDARLAVGEHDRNGCADIALDTNGGRTWLTPATSPERLAHVIRPK